MAIKHRVNKAWPVNVDLLAEQLSAALAAKYLHINLDVLNTVDVFLTDAALQADLDSATAVVTAHNASEQTATQALASATSVSRDQIMAYLKAQLTSATPEPTATIKAQVQAYVDTRPRLQNALINIAALYGYDTATNAGYLRSALVMVGLMD